MERGLNINEPFPPAKLLPLDTPSETVVALSEGKLQVQKGVTQLQAALRISLVRELLYFFF